MEKRHINRNRHLAAAVAAMALGGLAYNADASLQFSLVVDPTSNGFVNSGNANITGTSPITLDVVATVTGTSSTSFQGIQSADLNFTASGGTISGALTGATSAPFSGNASSGGTSSGLFLGSTDTTNVANWFVAHADNMDPTLSPAPIKNGATSENFTLGKVTFTPTAGSGSGTVQVGYRQAANGALWFEDAGTTAGTGSVPNIILTNDKELTGPGFTNATVGAAVNLNAVVTGVHDHWKQGVNSGNWGATGSWDDGVIPLATEAVTFGTTPGATGAAAVNLEGPHTTTGINFSSSASNNYTLSGSTLTIDNGASTAAIAVTAGNQTISAPVTLNSNTTVAAAVGTSLTMSSLNATAKAFSSTGAGTVTVDKLRTGAVSISGGGKVVVSANDGTSAGRSLHGSTVASLSISGAGSKLDLKNNTMVVQNTSAGNGGAGLVGIGGMIRSGAIGTTFGAVGGKTTGIGYAQGNDPGLAATSPIAGQSFTAADTVMKFTYLGDANLDGSVDGNDVGAWAVNFTGSGAGFTKTWTQGDWNNDGAVDGNDVGIWATNFTGSGGGVLGAPIDGSESLSGGVAAVPEPASLGLLMLAGALPLIRRRRKS